jgi:hypothetical protein
MLDVRKDYGVVRNEVYKLMQFVGSQNNIDVLLEADIEEAKLIEG